MSGMLTKANAIFLSDTAIYIYLYTFLLKCEHRVLQNERVCPYVKARPQFSAVHFCSRVLYLESAVEKRAVLWPAPLTYPNLG